MLGLVVAAVALAQNARNDVLEKSDFLHENARYPGAVWFVGTVSTKAFDCALLGCPTKKCKSTIVRL
jgi:hypothetical protein